MSMPRRSTTVAGACSPRRAIPRRARVQRSPGKPKKERARAIGKSIGEKLLALKVDAVVFDRNGFIYHGRVKEVADGARDAGLKF